MVIIKNHSVNSARTIKIKQSNKIKKTIKDGLLKRNNCIDYLYGLCTANPTNESTVECHNVLDIQINSKYGFHTN